MSDNENDLLWEKKDIKYNNKFNYEIISISSMCTSTIPCLHDCKIITNDKIYNKLITGNIIYYYFWENNIELPEPKQHFEYYKK